MTSEAKKVPPREQQFIRFIDTVKEAGNEPAIDELEETLNKLVPPIRAQLPDAPQDDPDQIQDT